MSATTPTAPPGRQSRRSAAAPIRTYRARTPPNSSPRSTRCWLSRSALDVVDRNVHGEPAGGCFLVLRARVSVRWPAWRRPPVSDDWYISHLSFATWLVNPDSADRFPLTPAVTGATFHAVICQMTYQIFQGCS